MEEQSKELEGKRHVQQSRREVRKLVKRGKKATVTQKMESSQLMLSCESGSRRSAEELTVNYRRKARLGQIFKKYNNKYKWEKNERKQSTRPKRLLLVKLSKKEETTSADEPRQKKEKVEKERKKEK